MPRDKLAAMKTSLLILAAACVFAAAAPAQSNTSISIAAGAVLPVGKLKDTQSAGEGGSAGLTFGASDNPFGLRLSVGYDRLGKKTVSGKEILGSHVISGNGDVLFTFPGSLTKPYLLAGLGELRMQSDSSGAKSSTRFGFDLGAGVSFPLGSRGAFLESKLQSISQKEAKPVRYLQIVLGLLL
jgi:opacity protein-like surface antigen